jgi:hypothetical protein
MPTARELFFSRWGFHFPFHGNDLSSRIQNVFFTGLGKTPHSARRASALMFQR